MAGVEPLDINKASHKDLMSLKGISTSRAIEIITARDRLGGQLTVDSFKNLPKVPVNVYQPLLDAGAIVFGSPKAARDHDASSNEGETANGDAADGDAHGQPADGADSADGDKDDDGPKSPPLSPRQVGS